ncbi:MAG: glycosyltransferase [Tateyamaria sp.]|uniref:glycosyltransferase n=1 Tax=Tateyamaria sp. TaxID=1929288 RepID=UPI00326FF7F9
MYLPPRDPKAETVDILMAVYNGADKLPAQLNSFDVQTHCHWRLLASDDGSTDKSVQVLKTFGSVHPRGQVKVIKGPQQGASENFLRLLRHVANQDVSPSWIAFSDQDDVWLPDKISRALNTLRQYDPRRPTLYCSRTWVTCRNLSKRRMSAPRPRTPHFRNALVQNIAAGNTIVLNPAAVSLVLEAVNHVGPVVVHDWWLYQLVTGTGGKVVHDDMPSLLYRQHEANQIGVSDTAYARLRRLLQLLRGEFRAWNQTNIAALLSCGAVLRPDHLAMLESFARLSTLPVLKRMLLLKRLGLYRQTVGGTITLWFAVLFRLV